MPINQINQSPSFNKQNQSTPNWCLWAIKRTQPNLGDTNRGLTDAAVVAGGVVAGGVTSASFATTAALTAAATTAGTTATISAINASMNADGDLFKQTKDITKTSWDNTTSTESLQNIAISAAIAGAAAGAITWAKGSPNLEVGSYENSKVGINVEKDPASGQWVYEGTQKQASWTDTYIFGNQNPVFKGMNATTPSVASGAKGHDAWVDANHFGSITTGATAPPYIILNACAAAPGLCAIYVNTKTDNNFLRAND